MIGKRSPASALLPHPLTIILFIILSGGFGLTRLTYIIAIMNPLIDSRHRATALSSVSMFRRGANAALNTLVGFTVGISQTFTLIALGLIALGVGALSKPARPRI